MAKKLRFPLEMENGIEVRTLEELKENFSLGKVYSYYNNGKLLTWLKDRYLDDIVKEIEELDSSSWEFAQKLCDIFGVEYVQNNVDLEAEEEKNRRIAKVKEYTTESKYIDSIDHVAFDQEELYDLLDENVSEIYLCGDKFEIPLSKFGITYEGINSPLAVINSDTLVDWEKIGITIHNVRFNDAYQQLILLNEKENINVLKKNDLFEDYYNLNGDKLLQRIEEEINKNSDIADKARYMLNRLIRYSDKARNNTKYNLKEQLEIASNNKYKAAFIRYVLDYLSNDEQARTDCIQMYADGNFLNSEEENDPFILYELGVLHIKDNTQKQVALELIKKAADKGFWVAEISMGHRYKFGDIVEKNYYKAIEWYQKVADKGLPIAGYYLSELAIFYVPDKSELGQKYIIKAFEEIDFKTRFMNNDNNYIGNPEKYSYTGGPFKIFLNERGNRNAVRRAAENKISKYISDANNVFHADSSWYRIFVNSYKNDFKFYIKRFILTAIANGKIADVNGLELQDYLAQATAELDNMFSSILYEAAPNFNVNNYLNVDYQITKALGSALFDDSYEISGAQLDTLHNDFTNAKKHFEEVCYNSYKKFIKDLYTDILK